ncbi:MAG: helix-turn-helix domain-containing protein [Nostocales cyanobacterium]|nr:MAG: helix-turn-helix domain-containing protein [Nostocales cyanobacterium]
MTVLNKSQAEQLKEITANLRHIRQEKSISLEQIAMHTHIRLAVLQALEEWRFEELPEPIFVQGFIRRYADNLGLDGTVLANSFELNLTPIKSHNSTQPLILYIPLFVPYIFLLIAASAGLFYLLKSELTGKSLANKQNPISSVQPKTIPSQLSPDVKKTSVNISSQSPSTLKKRENLQPISHSLKSRTTKSLTNISITNVAVTLKLQGNSWLQVKADGKTEFEGILTTGQRKTWTAKKSLTIRSGNAGAVLVSVNEQEPKLLGNEGQVKEVTYTN